VVKPDATVIASGETATFDVLGRLVTAGDEGIDPRSLTVVDGPGSGTARAVDGRIVYTPAPFWLGKESLTYRVCDTTGDRRGCARATLEVTTTRRVETVEVALRGQPRHEFGVGMGLINRDELRTKPESSNGHPNLLCHR
jgi:hypothetical protein